MITLTTQDPFNLGFPVAIIAAVLFIFLFLIVLIKRYKRCPSDRILVVYGKVGGGQSAKCASFFSNSLSRAKILLICVMIPSIVKVLDSAPFAASHPVRVFHIIVGANLRQVPFDVADDLGHVVPLIVAQVILVGPFDLYDTSAGFMSGAFAIVAVTDRFGLVGLQPVFQFLRGHIHQIAPFVPDFLV